jgi:hypothetical protein
MVRPGSERPTGRRSARTRGRFGRETPSSKPGRWARKRDAAEGSRREHKRRERGRNPTRPWDFAARGPPRASAKSPRVERRTSVNRSPCGRRTSLGAGAGMSTPPCRQYTRIGGEIPRDSVIHHSGGDTTPCLFFDKQPERRGHRGCVLCHHLPPGFPQLRPGDRSASAMDRLALNNRMALLHLEEGCLEVAI